jgi:hypothetical protein
VGDAAHAVNAYYHPTRNEIVFPAGILQPALFDADADDAVNSGGIGTVIAHEITHGFDDQGRRFDVDGTFRDWWTAEDEQRFKELAHRLAAQFDEYVVLDAQAADVRDPVGAGEAAVRAHGGHLVQPFARDRGLELRRPLRNDECEGDRPGRAARDDHDDGVKSFQPVVG